VLASGGSQRESAAGFGRRLAAAATGRAGQGFGRGRGRSKPDSETASKPASKAVCQGVEERQATSRGERTSNARQQPFATSTSIWGNRRLVCERVSVPDDLPFAE
jgi:hypothetical protein